MASGLIVGESLFGVVVAALIVVTGNASPLAVVGDGFLARGDMGRAAAVRRAARLFLSPYDQSCTRPGVSGC